MQEPGPISVVVKEKVQVAHVHKGCQILESMSELNLDSDRKCHTWIASVSSSILPVRPERLNIIISPPWIFVIMSPQSRHVVMRQLTSQPAHGIADSGRKTA